MKPSFLLATWSICAKFKVSAFDHVDSPRNLYKSILDMNVAPPGVPSETNLMLYLVPSESLKERVWSKQIFSGLCEHEGGSTWCPKSTKFLFTHRTTYYVLIKLTLSLPLFCNTYYSYGLCKFLI